MRGGPSRRILTSLDAPRDRYSHTKQRPIGQPGKRPRACDPAASPAYTHTAGAAHRPTLAIRDTAPI
ncbi:hypothetical protein DP59_5778 [Burkholderia pseudomallei]|nr:hypothetical protein DP59_5778 [Burkholderia pseudomallei]